MWKELRRTRSKLIATVAIGGLALTACGGDGSSSESGEAEYVFNFANGSAVGTPHEAVQNRYMDMIEERSDGRIAFDRGSFEAECKLAEIVECIKDGRADIGTTVTDYTPNMLPSLSVVSISLMNTDMQATTAALYDVHKDYEPAHQLLEDNNLHLASSWPVGSMFIGSAEPVESLDDLDGLRARAAGPVTQQTLENAGINVSGITAAETYESVQRGVIDSVASALDFAVNYAIIEQLPYWTDPGLGQYTAYGMWWNNDAYNSLPDDLREIVDEVTDELNYGEGSAAYNEQMEDVCQGMIDSPDVKDFTHWTEENVQEWRDEVGDDAENKWLETVDGYGFDGAEEYLDEYKKIYESHVSDDNPTDAAIACVDQWQEERG